MKNILLVFMFLLLLNAQASAKTVTLSPGTATVLFKIQHDQGYTTGYFNEFAGTVEVSDDATQVTSADAQVQTASVFSRSPVRDEGLRSPLFFDSEKFPSAAFKATKAEGGQLSGDLTIKGITKPVTLTVQQEAGKLILKGSFNRNDFGMTYNDVWSKDKKAIGDIVELVVELNQK